MGFLFFDVSADQKIKVTLAGKQIELFEDPGKLLSRDMGAPGPVEVLEGLLKEDPLGPDLPPYGEEE